ncbi:DNA mismatch endonuclease Vsr [Parabacteroides sp. AF17-28]|uniref:very short patch repair endonuclease n=1 Tax=Parabacteroides sp. AF17-28 TaxID=2292241 RepID=UPI000F00F588|nr:very short patch repair endonuclease [Parabacteroides sp. AF17-28]RHR49028.1 DNA mismatch endonuclease Vsr [Parabacteroides sp. AF17-28]
MDIWEKDKRSEIMSRVNQKDTKPELIVRHFLFANGFRYRKNVKSLPGSPDVVLPKYKTVVFINGCFWHGHECRAGRKPTSNRTYWDDKIETNMKRDQNKIMQLEAMGWKVLIVWQCEIKNIKLQNIRLKRLVDQILS